MSGDSISGGVMGAIGALLIIYIFRRKKKENDVSSEIDQNADSQPRRKKFFDRWAVKLAALGLALGIFGTLGKGYSSVGYMIGMGIPMAVMLGLIGLLIDFFNRKK